MRRWWRVFVAIAVFLAATMGAGVPAAHAAGWPFPDANNLPLLVDDNAAGSVAASYRIVSTGSAPFFVEAAANAHTKRFLGGMIALWEINDPAHSFFTATTTLTSTSRIRIASELVGVDTDTEPLQAGGPVLITTGGTLAAGTYELVMLIGGEEPNADTMFRIHAGSGIAVVERSFGTALIAGEEMFRGAANITAAASNAIADGTIHAAIRHTMTGVFLTPEAVGISTGPDGSSTTPSEAKFLAARSGNYDFTVAAGVDSSEGGSPSAVLLADVALA